MKKVLLICIFSMFALVLFAQSVVINKKWIEFNVVQNGIEGMKVHVDFDIKGKKGKNCELYVYIDCPKGVGVDDLDGHHCTTDGKVAFWVKFKPGYANTHYANFVIFIPLKDIHMKKGKNTYYCDIRIIDKDAHKFLNSHTYLSFIGWGNNEQPVQKQKDVTTFMGIPVDGTETEMAKRLAEKGFVLKKMMTEYGSVENLMEKMSS